MLKTTKFCQRSSLATRIKSAFILAIFSFILLLSGCGGGEVIENNETAEASDGTTLTVQLIDQSGAEIRNLGKKNEARIKAILKSSNGTPISNTVITFKADLATLDPEGGTELTDGNGIATIKLITGEIVGAGNVQATVTTPNQEVITATFNYAVGGTTETPNQTAETQASFTLALLDNEGNETRKLERNSTAVIEVTLNDFANVGIQNEVVTFTAELGTISPLKATALTDENGKASVTISSGLQVGAGLITAAVTIGDVEDKVNYSYEVFGELIDVPEQTLTVTLKDEDGNEIRKLERNASATIEATLVDSENAGIQNEVVNFTAELATISPAVAAALTDENGKAVVTITAGSDVGAGQVTAAISVDDVEEKIKYSYEIFSVPITEEPRLTGSIEFVSATPENIVLQNTGGTDLSEFSVVTFRVKGTDGLPIEGTTVDFSLSKTTDIGGLAIDPFSSVTNAEGLVSTTLQAGTVPTVINVKATTNVDIGNGEEKEIEANSNNLIVATGRPDQNSISLSLDVLNPEAWDIDGVEVDVTARLADHYNNWIPDGTPVYFTTEGGSIDASCKTVNSACSVKWVSQEPRPSDHRVTILATTLGGEGFVDTNSDGVYTIEDGEPYIDMYDNDIYDEPFVDANGNSVFDEPFIATGNGRWDIGEAFTDQPNGRYDLGEDFTDLPDGVYTEGEEFTDLNGDGTRQANEEFIDSLGNGFWNFGEPFIDEANGVYDPGEPFVDLPTNNYKLGNIFIDYNRNVLYSGNGNNPDGETVYTERNRNTKYDGAGILPDGDPLPVGFDLNGNEVFDGPGYADLGEPFLDSDEDNQYDFGEIYFDTNNDNQMNLIGDGKLNSYLCQPGNNCSEENVVHIRDSVVLVMSGSNPLVVAQDAWQDITYISNDNQIRGDNKPVDIMGGGSRSLVVYITDSAAQPMPLDTQISVSSDVGKLSGTTSLSVANTNKQFYTKEFPSGVITPLSRYHIYFSITDTDLIKFENGFIDISITTPSGLETTFSIPVRS